MMRTVAGVLIGILLVACMTMGGPSFARADVEGFGIVPVEELDATRGGYKTGTGHMFSFGIEKAVYVNGVLEATSSMNLLQPGGSAGLSPQEPPFQLIQIGSGNPAAGKNSSAFTLPGQGFQGTIIQNSLDGQTITNITRITVGLDVLGAYRENNLSTVLSQQLIRSLR